jgi:chemotaxis protein MotB
MAKSDSPIIIKKRIEEGEGGHHGGAWKVAYADFVTAMMAFFLLLWLLGSTTEDKRKSLAEYFTPSISVSNSPSGAGGVLGGITVAVPGSMSSPSSEFSTQQSMPGLPENAKVEDSHTLDAGTSDDGTDDPFAPDSGKGGKSGAMTEEQEKRQFDEAAEKLRQAIRSNPDLQPLAEHLVIDQTPEGMRIQIVDGEGKSMFPRGSAQMFEDMRKLLAMVVQAIGPLPNRISVRGHTDATPFANNPQGNWDLSSQRASATLRALASFGLDARQITDVSGRADVDPLIPADPMDPRNRRISIVLLKQHPTPAPAPAPAK